MPTDYMTAAKPENAHTQHVNGYDWEREWLRACANKGKWEQARATETSLGMSIRVGEGQWEQVDGRIGKIRNRPGYQQAAAPYRAMAAAVTWHNEPPPSACIVTRQQVVIRCMHMHTTLPPPPPPFTMWPPMEGWWDGEGRAGKHIAQLVYFFFLYLFVFFTNNRLLFCSGTHSLSWW